MAWPGWRGAPRAGPGGKGSVAAGSIPVRDLLLPRPGDVKSRSSRSQGLSSRGQDHQAAVRANAADAAAYANDWRNASHPDVERRTQASTSGENSPWKT